MPTSLSFSAALSAAIEADRINPDLMRRMRQSAQESFFRNLQTALTMLPSGGYGINWDVVRPPFSSYDLPPLHRKAKDAKGQLKLEFR